MVLPLANSKITITALTITGSGAGIIYVIVQYRKLGDIVWLETSVDSVYAVPSTGILNPPIEITGLLPATTYQVRCATKECFGEEYIQNITTPGATCPAVTDISYTTENY